MNSPTLQSQTRISVYRISHNLTQRVRLLGGYDIILHHRVTLSGGFFIKVQAPRRILHCKVRLRVKSYAAVSNSEEDLHRRIMTPRWILHPQQTPRWIVHRRVKLRGGLTPQTSTIGKQVAHFWEAERKKIGKLSLLNKCHGTEFSLNFFAWSI